jgi:hypothetical protein
MKLRCAAGGRARSCPAAGSSCRRGSGCREATACPAGGVGSCAEAALKLLLCPGASSCLQRPATQPLQRGHRSRWACGSSKVDAELPLMYS